MNSFDLKVVHSLSLISHLFSDLEDLNHSFCGLNLDSVVFNLFDVLSLLSLVLVEFKHMHLQVTHSREQLEEGNDKDHVFVLVLDELLVVLTLGLGVFTTLDLAFHQVLDKVLVKAASGTTNTSVEVINTLHNSSLARVGSVRTETESENSVHDTSDNLVVSKFTINELLDLVEILLLVTARLKILVSRVSKLVLSFLKIDLFTLHSLGLVIKSINFLVDVINLALFLGQFTLSRFASLGKIVSVLLEFFSIIVNLSEFRLALVKIVSKHLFVFVSKFLNKFLSLFTSLGIC